MNVDTGKNPLKSTEFLKSDETSFEYFHVSALKVYFKKLNESAQKIKNVIAKVKVLPLAELNVNKPSVKSATV